MILPQQAKLLISTATPNTSYSRPTHLYGFKKSAGPDDFNLTTSVYGLNRSKSIYIHNTDIA
jgi:hypothetical protein